VILNSEIDIDGDTALAVSDAMFLNPVGGEVKIALMWRFHDDFVKRGGRWQIARRRFSRQCGTPLPSSSVPPAPGQAGS
jgi:hypothetical protein